jgi:uncharacterized protein (TIGR00251 family)
LKITVKAKPGSSVNQVIKIDENNYEVKVQTSPDKGKANRSVIKLLSTYFKIPASHITICSGAASRIKIIEIDK